MDISKIHKKTDILESQAKFKRIRTHCIDDEVVRKHYADQVSDSMKFVIVDFTLDILMNMVIKLMDNFKGQLPLTQQELQNFEIVKQLHNQIHSTTLGTMTWELPWAYQNKAVAEMAAMQYFVKKIELGSIQFPVENE